MGALLADPTFWVAVAFFLFVGIAVYLRVPAKVAKMLDARAAAIARELDEAKRLRDEAQTLFEQYQMKARAADSEAAGIVAAARAESGRIAAEARAQIEQLIQRRTAQAEQKIAQAETQAAAEVRAAAAEAAIAAAAKMIAERMDTAKADALTDAAIRELKSKLN